ncbi:MAG: polyamine ABC transporter substrate-binding protein [Rhizobiales bacterium]|nr:polyamine ABC transporter substrate-binding protein [Hyphomicrobiales bacterium]
MKTSLIALSVALAATLAAPAFAQEKIVNVYNWSDYIDPKSLEEFTRETGIKVVYDTYDSNEMLEAKLLAGKTGYDVVAPTTTFMQREIQAGVLQKLDKTRLPNKGNLWPELMTLVARYDAGNDYAVPYMWSTTGIAYNAEKVKARLGDQPMDTWDVLFKPELLKKLSDCGVYVLDSPEDLVTNALNYLKLDPNSKKPEELKKASELLQKMRPNVKKFHSSEYINALASGDICMAVGWGGDSLQARNRAREAKNGVEIVYAIPREGTLISLDSFVIPKDAPHVEEAHAFINFMMRPEIAARNTNLINFANAVLASKPFLDKEVAENKSVYPSEETMKRLFTVQPYDAATQKIVTREWTRVKTGK